jgi:aminoglycoside phosphotransferase (APT) family kinase protein
MEISSPIAQGRTAEVFLWDDKHVLKLYRDWCPLDWVDHEARIARAIHNAGVPSPAAGEIVEINDRRGLIYERLEGISMLQDMNARPWMLWKHARSLAELQVKVNRQSIAGLPLYKDRLSYDIRNSQYLSLPLIDKALAWLDTLPEGRNVCHGDYHPGNVLLTKDGPVVIDWVTASTGSPWADAARTSLILRIGAKAAGKQVRPMIRMAIRFYHRVYINQYRSLIQESGNELQRWTPVISAARLGENIIPEREALIKIVKESFAE